MTTPTSRQRLQALFDADPAFAASLRMEDATTVVEERDAPESVDEILEAQRAIVDGAENRDFTDDEVETYEALEAQLVSRSRSEGIRARQQAYETPVAPAAAAAVHVAASQPDDTLERAFNHYLRTGVENDDLQELRAQSEGVGSEGGFLVPDGFRAKLVDRMLAFGGIANAAETITTSTGNPLPWPTLDDTANSGEVVQEGGVWSAGADLVFGSDSLGAHTYAAGGGASTPIRLSIELLQDSAVDVEAVVSGKLGQRLARAQAGHLVTGTGVQQPKGLVHGKTGIELNDDTAGVTYDDLITFIHSVDPAYREMGCAWAFNDLSLATIHKIKDSNGDPIWRPDNADIGAGLGGGVLLGYPVIVDQGFPDIDVDNNSQNWGAFGNFNLGFIVRRVQDVAIVVNPWTRASNRQVEYSAYARMDARPQDANAYVALTGEQP